MKIAHMMIYQEKNGGHADPFWDQAAQLLVQACILRFSVNDNALMFWALQYGKIATVLEPKRLVDKLRQETERLADKYIPDEKIDKK